MERAADPSASFTGVRSGETEVAICYSLNGILCGDIPIEDYISVSRIKQQKTFGAAVRAMRARLGLNQADFGAQIGCNQNTVSRYEAGKLLPRSEILMAVWVLADHKERHLLRAYIAEIFSFAAKGKQPLLDPIDVEEAVAGFANPVVLSRFRLLYEQYMTAPDAIRLFIQAADWLETEFKMRAAGQPSAAGLKRYKMVLKD